MNSSKIIKQTSLNRRKTYWKYPW